MNLAQRFSLIVKGNFAAAMDRLEDPERSLNQLILDMEEQLEAAKRATAAAMANEERLQLQIVSHRRDAERLNKSARRALAKGREEDARQALRRAEEATRQADRLAEKLADQKNDTQDVTDSVAALHQRLEEARSRLHLVQARIRQRDARQSAGQVMRGVERADLYAEFERIEGRVELQMAEEKAYARLDDRLRGVDLTRRLDADELDDAVEDRLEALRREAESEPSGTPGEAPL